ncbi:hypothetical protein GGP41_002269 [Bipolaris sorokiniana]|uniref:Uncharacterized protein n=1 Tax=Cochliobolus sativus TaxID=45130 RepID=A0A8H5Z9K2_COCSA|nr:hypothetical protein GGP41_002269 [Bipolaris sorokiniana]
MLTLNEIGQQPNFNLTPTARPAVRRIKRRSLIKEHTKNTPNGKPAALCNYSYEGIGLYRSLSLRHGGNRQGKGAVASRALGLARRILPRPNN